MKMRTYFILTAILGSFLIPQQNADAGARRFTFVYEATTAAQGEIELENWVTWKSQRSGGDTFDFRHEIEYGVTDRLQIALYLADWRIDNGHVSYQNTAFEVIYNLTNPVTDIVGSALYGEVKLGDEKFELEGKAILQKNFGPLVVAYNATFEAEWEGERFGYFNERKGKFEQSFGASWQFTPNFLLGGEVLHEIEFENWSEVSESLVYLGPNASFRYKQYFVTTTAMVQATALSGEAEFQLRTIFGFHF